MIKESLFFINFIKLLNLFSKELLILSAEAVLNRIEMLKNIHNNISRMQKTTSKRKNIKRKLTSQLKKRDKVYFLTIKVRLFFIMK